MVSKHVLRNKTPLAPQESTHHRIRSSAIAPISSTAAKPQENRMQAFQTNDRVVLKYLDTRIADSASREKPLLILIHGFTGTSAVWQRILPALAEKYRVIAPDLRGHGESGKPKHGYHVSRLTMDLRELLEHLCKQLSLPKLEDLRIRAIGGSLGCSILWCYAELFSTKPFTHMIFVDQSPLQNSTLNGWDSRYCNRGMNSAPAVAALQTTLQLSPETAHKGTIAACLSYLSHPLPTDNVSAETFAADEAFFLGEAMKGNAEWYGNLMADHTSLDWRDSIAANFGPGSGSQTKVLVIASVRSGCFPAAGPLKVVEFIVGPDPSLEKLAEGVEVSDGGHWCYWESPESFNKRCLDFLGK